ncbi:MAG TPA: hypothetical protein PL143_17365 [Rhodocyclaceae bacterium]|nr:hypothetical protein [Rhodocyclaceae bacterium]
MTRAACAAPSMLAAVVLAGCVGVASSPRMVEGECADMHGARICTWAFVDGAGRVVEYGATIPLALVDNAPRDV